MERTVCSETSAYKIQKPVNYPDESIQHHDPVQRSPVLIRILKRMNQSTHFLPTTSGIILTLFSDRRLGPSFIFSDHKFVGICRLSHAWHKPRPSHPPFYYRNLNKTWLKYKFSLWTSVQPPVTSRFFIHTFFWTPCYQHPHILFPSFNLLSPEFYI
jgi:hypothetical protein